MKNVFRTIIVAVALGAAALSTWAAGYGTPGLSPLAPPALNGAQAFIGCVGTTATLVVTYGTNVDAGAPGLFGIALTSSTAGIGQGQAMLLGEGNVWWAYQGGLYVPQATYRSGLPAALKVTTAMPASGEGGATNTSSYAGWTVLAGHGVLTQEAQTLVAQRRVALNSVRDQRIAAGKWNPMYDDDDRFRWSLVQKDLMKNNKYVQLGMVPMIDCNPPPTFGG